MSMSKAFTLLETLVAVTLLTVAIAGPFAVAERSFVAAAGARDQLIASYLAQEGVEYVRAMRDSTYLAAVRDGKSDLTFTAFYTDFLFEDGGTSIPTTIRACRDPDGDTIGDGFNGSDRTEPALCELDPGRPMGVGVGSALTLCGSGACGRLYLTDDGRYTLDSGAGTITHFTRSIRFFDLSNSGEEVEVTVSWR